MRVLPALESAHAIAEVARHAPNLSPKKVILVNLSGRGDKDVESVLEYDERRERPGNGETAKKSHPARTWERVRWGERE